MTPEQDAQTARRLAREISQIIADPESAHEDGDPRVVAPHEEWQFIIRALEEFADNRTAKVNMPRRDGTCAPDTFNDWMVR